MSVSTLFLLLRLTEIYGNRLIKPRFYHLPISGIPPIVDSPDRFLNKGKSAGGHTPDLLILPIMTQTKWNMHLQPGGEDFISKL